MLAWFIASACAHDGMLARSMNHHEFGYNAVFGDAATNDTVYAGSAAPLVREAASGGHAAVMMYGQTGSGKTYTMSAIYERAAAELFATVGDEAVQRGAVCGAFI